MKTLNQTDSKMYLENGPLSQPFLKNDFVKEKVMIDYNHKLQQGKLITQIESLCNWIHHMVKHSNDNNFIKANQFQRTAEDIWESKQTTGCTDYALLFATFARQIGLPTTILHTAELNWIKRLKSGEDYKVHYGHSFCECFYNGKWLLVDPTCRKILLNYNPEQLELDYTINGNNIFIPYFRGLDLEKKQTIKQHNDLMEKECLTLII